MPDIVRLFESRRGHLERRVTRDYVRNGIVTIPCRISCYDDVIAGHSARGFETLDAGFVDYVKGTTELTPSECPIVLEIIEDCLTQKERRAIAEAVRDDFGYGLGVVERDGRRHAQVFCIMLVCLALSGVALWLFETGPEVSYGLLCILFGYAGYVLCEYVFLTGPDLRRKRRLAGRLASVKVTFTRTYEEPAYSADDVCRLHSEIERDVDETLTAGE